VAEAESVVRGAAQQLSGWLRVATAVGFGHMTLLPIVQRFLAGPGASAPVGTAQSVRVSGRLQTNSSEVVRAAVLAGDGIGYSPVWLFGPELQSGEVVALLPDWQAPVLPMHLVSPPSRRHSAKVRLFGDFVAAGLAHEA